VRHCLLHLPDLSRALRREPCEASWGSQTRTLFFLFFSFNGLRNPLPIPFPYYPTNSPLPCLRKFVKERAMKSARIAFEEKLAELSRFKQFLRGEDRAVFDDLLSQCTLYAGGGEVFASPVKEMSLLFSMIFAHHKKLAELEKHVNDIPN
jgi:hypothetical protein